METQKILIPDNEGNHLVVVLYFYGDNDKLDTFQIPEEFTDLDIADISINKLYLDRPLMKTALYKMYHWLLEKFMEYPNAVFTFICSTDPLETKNNHTALKPESYRGNLFECLYTRYKNALDESGIRAKDIIVGPDEYQTFAKVFYRDKHSAIIHLVIAHLTNKYAQ